MRITIASAALAASMALLGSTIVQAGEGGPDAIGGQGAGSPAAAHVSNGATVGGLSSGQAPTGFSPAQIQRERDTPSQGTTGQARQPQPR